MLGLRPDGDTLEAAVRDFDIRRVRRARALRRMVLMALAGFVLAGAFNLLGGRSATAVARSGGYELQVTHAAVSRPGHDADWDVELRHTGGFPGPVRLATDFSYLDMFDQPTVLPEPRSSVVEGGRIVWEFDPPAGDTLQVSLEAELGQESMGVHPGSTAVLGPDGDVIRVAYRTVVLP